jgi:hypothetical protein
MIASGLADARLFPVRFLTRAPDEIGDLRSRRRYGKARENG